MTEDSLSEGGWHTIGTLGDGPNGSKQLGGFGGVRLSAKIYFECLEMVLSDFCGRSLICELILALVSFWLLVNSFKETSKEKRLIDFFDYFIQN